MDDSAVKNIVTAAQSMNVRDYLHIRYTNKLSYLLNCEQISDQTASIIKLEI